MSTDLDQLKSDLLASIDAAAGLDAQVTGLHR